MKISERLRHLRQRRGLTMKETARRLQVPYSTYRDWEYGRKIPAEQLARLSQIFGLPVSALTGSEVQPENEIQRVALLLEEALQTLRKIR